MRNKHTLAILVVIFTLLASASVCYAQPLDKPSVMLPASWELSGETVYPDSVSEHDSEGAGLLEYQNAETYDYVMIYYERATTSYTSGELKTEATRIFSRDESDLAISESGTTTISGVQAGFAKGYDSEFDIYYLDVVFVKDQYYVNVFSVYQGNQQSSDAVLSLIDSIEVSTSSFEGTMIYLIVGVAAVVVVAIITVVILRRGRKSVSAATQVQTNSGNVSPPPQASFRSARQIV